jgi:hypothetical protein
VEVAGAVVEAAVAVEDPPTDGADERGGTNVDEGGDPVGRITKGVDVN